MSVLEVTKNVGDKDHQAAFSIKRNNTTGYFLLEPFLPLLQQYSEQGGQDQGPINFHAAEEVSSEQEDELLSQYGILVDTDNEGKKWITGEKAIDLLQLLGIFHIFEPDLNVVRDNNEHNEHANDTTSLDTAQDDSTSHARLDELNSNDENNSRQDTTLNTGTNAMRQIKRHNNDLDLGGKLHKELGSPLKKLRTSKYGLNGEQSERQKASEAAIDNSSSISRKIRTFNHDLDSSILKLPVKIQKAQNAPLVSDHNQRMKLETFLQRLLFPVIQDISSSDGSSQPLSFEVALQEVDSTYPNIPLNLNIPVDERGNTPIHWLASIANLELVRDLVEHGANRFLGDNIGESALVKAVKSVNNYDSGTFEALLDLLYPCLILEDSLSRTILHHIVITSGMPGCSSAAKYYLDILMGWIVKKQSRVLDGAGADPIYKTLDLKWVISNMLNAPDSNGDTCLNIASRLGNVAIVDALLDYGADPYVANKSGLRPVDFGAGTSKLHANGASSNLENNPSKSSLHEINSDVNVPDTMSLVSGMQSLLETVSKDYSMEVKEHQDKLNKLHKELNSHREVLAASRDRLAHAKQLQDEHAVLKEQLGNIKQGILEEEEKFRNESKNLGLSSEDASGADWDSSEFDADEPFRVDFIYEILENKLASVYNGDVEKLLSTETLETLLDEVRSIYSSQQDKEKIENILPPSVLLSARITAYKRNDVHLNSVLEEIRQKQKDLESKFRRVLCLCLKIDEDKVDGMLDGLLQAISSEDPQDVDTDEMQEFLKKHNV